MKETTICAVSTPLGTGGIGVVRLSGPDAIAICEQLFRSGVKKRLSELAGYTGTLGKVFDHKGDVDEAIAFVYRAPHSYTGEDVVELSCHGGIWIVQKILRLCLAQGAVAASPGEFTKRAFLNGKMDLSQAEAVMDLIHSQGDTAMRAALAAKGGLFSSVIESIVEGLLSLSSHLAAWADYPDEDMAPVDAKELSDALHGAIQKIEDMLSTWDVGRVMREGVDTVIVGKPNVGKSTLMNLLSGSERSIVTHVPGTTRDVVEDRVALGDLVLNLADTAGVRKTDDLVEQIGVDRTRQRIEAAHLILAVFDISDTMSEEDQELLAILNGKPGIAIVNKTDLEPVLDCSQLEKLFSKTIYLSAKTGSGRKELEQAIHSLLRLDQLDTSAAMVSTERQRQSLEQARLSLQEAVGALDNGMTWDAVNVSIDDCLHTLFSLTGKRVSDEVVDAVFSRFCVGK